MINPSNTKLGKKTKILFLMSLMLFLFTSLALADSIQVYISPETIGTYKIGDIINLVVSLGPINNPIKSASLTFAASSNVQFDTSNTNLQSLTLSGNIFSPLTTNNIISNQWLMAGTSGIVKMIPANNVLGKIPIKLLKEGTLSGNEILDIVNTQFIKDDDPFAEETVYIFDENKDLTIEEIIVTVAAPPCTPSCAGKECGDNGCGGVCGTCADGLTCGLNSQCSSCTPKCTGTDGAPKQCGADGCGGVCGTNNGNCPVGQGCNLGNCIANQISVGSNEEYDVLHKIDLFNKDITKYLSSVIDVASSLKTYFKGTTSNQKDYTVVHTERIGLLNEIKLILDNPDKSKLQKVSLIAFKLKNIPDIEVAQ